MRYWATLIGLLLCQGLAFAQDVEATAIVAQILEEMSADGTLTEDFEDEAAELVALASDKIDLNTASYEQISKIFFLTEKQKETLISKRERFGPYRSDVELITLPYFSISDVERLLHFASVEKSIAEVAKPTTAQIGIVSRIERTYPTLRGFKAPNDTTHAPFWGDKYKKLLRINASLGEKLSGGLVAESDAGEPMFSHGISVTDFLSGYLLYRPRKKFVRKLIVGHYSAQFGQGLGLWTGFSADMSSFQASIMRSAMGLNGNMSASESGYLRGAAVAMGNERITIDLFFSLTDGDASLVALADSSATEYYASNIQTSGYHRTTSELSKRNNFQQMLAGGYLKRTWKNLNVGVGFNQWRGSMPIGNQGELYKLFYPTSQNIGNVHADYRLVCKSLMAYGEVDYQSVGAWAAMQGIDVDLGNGNMLTLAGRTFGKRYYSLYQNPFSIATRQGGESGVYIGLQLYPFSRISVNANVNVFHHSWLLYQRYAPTNGYKGRITIARTFSQNNIISLRFRIDDRDDASATNNRQIERMRRTSLKLVYRFKTISNISFRTEAEKIHFKQADQRSDGFWIAEEVSAHALSNCISAHVQLAHFDAQSYDSRIFATQPDVLYSMSMPSYIGRGVLGIASVCISPMSAVDIWLWCRHVKYFDRDVISSGNTQIDASHKTDVKLQARIKLRYWRAKN